MSSRRGPSEQWENEILRKLSATVERTRMEDRQVSARSTLMSTMTKHVEHDVFSKFSDVSTAVKRNKNENKPVH